MTETQRTEGGELKPCPFCGSGAAHHEIEDMDDPNFGGHFICCNVCGASTNLRFAGGDDPRPLLAEQWNRRPEPSSLIDDEDERGFTPSDYAHTAELLRSSEALRKAAASNNHNIILAALDICANRRSTDRREGEDSSAAGAGPLPAEHESSLTMATLRTNALRDQWAKTEAFDFGSALRLIDNLLRGRGSARANQEAEAFLARHQFRRLCR